MATESDWLSGLKESDMVTSACFIPIKSNSERVPRKNFRLINDKKLYEYIFEHVKEANVFDEVFVDTNSQEIMEYAEKIGVTCEECRKCSKCLRSISNSILGENH